MELAKTALVMAAGQGTRMKSELPKVLVPVLGRPMIEYVLDALDAVGIERIVVIVGYRAELVREQLAGRPRIEFVEQSPRLGTGHAVMCCRDLLAQCGGGAAFVLAGDCPMIQAASLDKMLTAFAVEQDTPRGAACVLGTAYKEHPDGLGRIVRDNSGDFLRIVEERDATEEERRITEVNMSYYLFSVPDLLEALPNLQPNNAQGEYYITDVPAILQSLGHRAIPLPVLQPIESLGINTMDELRIVEAALSRDVNAE